MTVGIAVAIVLSVLVAGSQAARADAKSDCQNWKNIPADQSIAACTTAIHIGGNAAWNYNNRGNAYYSTKDYDKAIADYIRAINLVWGFVCQEGSARGLSFFIVRFFVRLDSPFLRGSRSTRQTVQSLGLPPGLLFSCLNKRTCVYIGGAARRHTFRRRRPNERRSADGADFAVR